MESEQVITFSVSVRESLLQSLTSKVPRWGDRSKVICKLIEMYLRGEIQVDLRKN